MTIAKSSRLLMLAAALAAAMGTGQAAAAQSVSLNYENLSSMEEPLALELGDTTFLVSGLGDTPTTLNLEDGRETNADFIGNMQISARTQLPNRWRVELTWFGQYVSDESLGSGQDGQYEDNAALSLGGSWGTLLGGEVSGVVREQTRRLRGAGNAFLAFDDAMGELENRSGGYVGRFGPWVISSIVDEDNGFDLGAMFQRPIGDRDYRLSARFTKGGYTSSDGLSRFDTEAISGVGELTHGSTSFDIGAGYERFISHGPDIDRWYVSSGVRTKTGVLSLSLEGHYGRIEGEDEVSAALGLQYDVARGLSLNLGYNYADAELDLGGGSFIDTRDEMANFSLRYSF